MTPKDKLTMLAVLIAAASSSIPIARANSFQDILSNYFNKNSNNAYSGSAIENANQPAIRNNLDSQREALRQSINNARQSNAITNSQASELNSELDTISARELNDAATSGFAYAETASLVSAMSAVDARLQQFISYSSNNNVSTVVSGNGYYRQGNLASSDIRNRINSLSNRINRELQDGDISSQEASNLNFRVNTIKQQMPHGRNRNSNWSDVQVQGQLATIEARLAYDLQNRNQLNANFNRDGHNHRDRFSNISDQGERHHYDNDNGSNQDYHHRGNGDNQ